MLIDDVGVPRRAQSSREREPRANAEGVHRVDVEVAIGYSFPLRHREGLRCCRGSAIGELSKVGVDHRGHNSLTEVVVAGVETARVHAELHAVPTASPYEVVIDLPLRDLAALRIRLIVAADSGEGSVGTAASKHDRKSLLHLRVVVGKKETRIPARAGVELVDEVGREDVRVSCDSGPLRLRRIGVEDWVDGVGVGRLESGVLLVLVPDAVLRADRMVDLEHKQIFLVVVVQRLSADVRAPASVEEVGSALGSRQQRAAGIERAREYRRWRSCCAVVEAEHRLVKIDLTRLGGEHCAVNRVRATLGELL